MISLAMLVSLIVVLVGMYSLVVQRDNLQARLADQIGSAERANRLVELWKERHEHSQAANLESLTALGEALKKLDRSRAVVQGVESVIGCTDCERAVPPHLSDVVEAMGCKRPASHDGPSEGLPA